MPKCFIEKIASFLYGHRLILYLLAPLEEKHHDAFFSLLEAFSSLASAPFPVVSIWALPTQSGNFAQRLLSTEAILNAHWLTIYIGDSEMESTLQNALKKWLYHAPKQTPQRDPLDGMLRVLHLVERGQDVAPSYWDFIDLIEKVQRPFLKLKYFTSRIWK